MFRPRLWLPFLLFAIIALLVIWVLSKPFLPVIGPFVSSLSKYITGTERVVHYPDSFILLPMVFGWVSLVLSVLFESVLIGTAFLMFTGYYRSEAISLGQALSSAFRKYIQIFLIWLIILAVLVLVFRYVPNLFESMIAGSKRKALVFDVGLRMSAGVIVTAMLQYALPAILIDGDRFFSAIGLSFRTFFKNAISSYILAAVPVIISLPFTTALNFPMSLSAKFSPELVFYALVGSIIASMIASFISVSTVLRFYWEYAE